MTLNTTPDDSQLTLAPLDDKADHVRGSPAGRLIIEYGDYECPYSRQAFHAIEQVEQQLGGNMRFAFRHFPLTRIHPHALTAGTPTLFIDGVVHRGGYDPPTAAGRAGPMSRPCRLARSRPSR